MLSNCDIILSLLQSGHSHTCAKCERGMHVKSASGLCVWCYNEELAAARAPKVTRRISKRTVKRQTPEEASETRPTP